jgi:hypothetical protein
MSDSDIDYNLNKGIRFLDSITFTKQKNARLFLPLLTGNSLVTIPLQYRVIKSIWVFTSTAERTQLQKATLVDFRNNLEAGEIDTPIYYCTDSLNLPNMLACSDVHLFSNLGDLTVDQLSRTLLIWPVASVDYTVEVTGNFYSPSLSAAVLNNWWTLNQPDLILMASLYCMDRIYRNTSGGLELLKHIQDDIKSIHDDDIEEEVMTGNNSVLEG